MAIPTNDEDSLRGAAQSGVLDASFIARMQSAIDGMSADVSLTDLSLRDYVACVAALSRMAIDQQCTTTTHSQALAKEVGDPPLCSVKLGRYEIRQPLGHGGFGIVFLAFDTVLGREVAIKLPRPEFLASPETKRRLIREAQAVAVLDHPGIVPIFETGELGAVWFIACGFVDGPNLAEWQSRQKNPVSPRIAAGLVASIADAVQHAHERAVLHLDLKPSNVMLEALECEGRETVYEPRLTDFGLAGRIEEQTVQSRSFAVAGTLRYMSPEQLRGDRKQIGVASDVYGLGVVLYELLSGRVPFHEDSGTSLMRQIEEQEAPSIRLYRADLPRDLEAICLKCLEKLPQERYSSAHALAEDLRRYLNGLPVSARPIGPAKRLIRAVRQRPAMAAVTAVAIFTAVGGAAGIAAQSHRANLHAREAEIQAEVAEKERQDAQRHLAEAQRTLLNLAWLYQEAFPFIVGEQQVTNELNTRMAEYEQRLRDAKVPPEMRLPLIAVRDSFSVLSRRQNLLIVTSEDEALFKRAVDSWQAVITRWPHDGSYRRSFALLHLAIAELYRRGNAPHWAAHYRREAQKVLSPPWCDTEDWRTLVGTSEAIVQLAGSFRRVDRNEDAICLEQVSASIWTYMRQVLPDDDESLYQWTKARCRVLVTREDREQGRDADQSLAEIEEELLSARKNWESTHLIVHVAMADVLRRRASIALQRSDHARALELAQRADDELTLGQKNGKRGMHLRQTELDVLRTLASIHRSSGDVASTWEVQKRLRGTYHELQTYPGIEGPDRIHFARACAEAGTAALDVKLPLEAEDAFAEAVKHYGELLGRLRLDPIDLRAYAESATMLAGLHESAGKNEEAQKGYVLALELWKRLKRRAPNLHGVRERLALVENKLGAARSTKEPPADHKSDSEQIEPPDKEKELAELNVVETGK